MVKKHRYLNTSNTATKEIIEIKKSYLKQNSTNKTPGAGSRGGAAGAAGEGHKPYPFNTIHPVPDCPHKNLLYMCIRTNWFVKP